MIYAVNLFDLVEGREDEYRSYMKATAPLLDGLDAEPVLSAHRPIRSLHGEARQYVVVMKFGSIADFETMMERQKAADVGRLREDATTHYIWTLYEEWDVGAWLSSG